jgi:hypothetical protein
LYHSSAVFGHIFAIEAWVFTEEPNVIQERIDGKTTQSGYRSL